MNPFLLTPVLVERPWGGRRLQAYGKTLPQGTLIGESWEVADLAEGVASDDSRSRVASGPDEGATLTDMIGRHGTELMGSTPVAVGGEFPLLVKLLDAAENLSVQVHPHARYARAHPEVRLKTESWYVVEAEPGAELFLDLVEGATAGDLAAAVGTPSVVDLLRRLPARPGDFHHLPAGLVHSLGAGVMVAEVQTPSDTTFRIYDWSEEYGRPPRQLHTREALQTITIDPPGYVTRPGDDHVGSRELIDNPHYRIVEHRNGDRLTLGSGSAVSIGLVVKGAAELAGLSLPVGTTVVIPPTTGGEVAETLPGSVVLEVRLPTA